jgi:hypothetical protein
MKITTMKIKDLMIKDLIENYTELLDVLLAEPMTPEDTQQAYILKQVVADLKMVKNYKNKN